MRSMPVWYHETYTGGIDEAARFPRDRYKLLRDRLRGLEDTGLERVEDPPPANRKTLLMAHDEDYVDRFLKGRLDPKERRRIGLTRNKDLKFANPLAVCKGDPTQV